MGSTKDVASARASVSDNSGRGCELSTVVWKWLAVDATVSQLRAADLVIPCYRNPLAMLLEPGRFCLLMRTRRTHQ